MDMKYASVQGLPATLESLFFNGLIARLLQVICISFVHNSV